MNKTEWNLFQELDELDIKCNKTKQYNNEFDCKIYIQWSKSDCMGKTEGSLTDMLRKMLFKRVKYMKMNWTIVCVILFINVTLLSIYNFTS